MHQKRVGMALASPAHIMANSQFSRPSLPNSCRINSPVKGGECVGTSGYSSASAFVHLRRCFFELVKMVKNKWGTVELAISNHPSNFLNAPEITGFFAK